jgi:hypothetical protein
LALDQPRIVVAENGFQVSSANQGALPLNDYLFWTCLKFFLNLALSQLLSEFGVVVWIPD